MTEEEYERFITDRLRSEEAQRQWADSVWMLNTSSIAVPQRRFVDRFIGGSDPVEPAVADVDIATIHKDFRSVADRLLEEAKEVINNSKDDPRAERYKRLGFSGIGRVKKHEEAVREKGKYEELMRKIGKYRIKYPLCQFLDEESLDKLCKKYGLVYAPAEYFCKEIPDANLKELEEFSLHAEDIIKEHWTYPVSIGRKTVYSEKEARKYSGVVHHRGNNSFEVVASSDMFDVPSGYEFYGSTLRLKVPDPIVIRRVPLGFLIVTAWGPEAELPEINIDKQ
jgi:hypothetical protein